MPTARALESLRVLNRHWRPDGGYTSPNLDVYPWLWMWDSCFHALVWGAVADSRALVELESVFHGQDADGFVSHMGYQLDPPAAVELWGREGSSTVTQPPMYGHAARSLAAWGYELSQDLIGRIRRTFDFLWAHRRAANGLLSIHHPWEGGNDDSPRWDAWGSQPFDRFGAWRNRKLQLVDALQLSDEGAAVGSEFTVQPAGFNALTAFNLREFAALTGDETAAARADELTRALDDRWDDTLETWVDASPQDAGASRARTSDALLGVLVTPDSQRRDAVWRQLFDPTAYGAVYGPCGVHRSEAAFDPGSYWRGSTWPQLSYLFWVAAVREGRTREADRIAEQTASAVTISGHAEYWHPDTGQGLGARPQSWTALWLLMDAGVCVGKAVPGE